MTELFGWDLIYKLSEKDLGKKEDVLTLVIHYLLVRSGYKCVGISEDNNSLTGNEVPSESLPEGWNQSNGYSLKYLNGNNLFVLKGLPVDEHLLFNLISAEKVQVTNIAFQIDETVKAISGPLATMIRNYEDVLRNIQCNLITPMGNENTKEASTQSRNKEATVGRPPGAQSPETGYTGPSRPSVVPDPFWIDPERDPLRVGRSDLDPFGQGGGMIFNPFGNRTGFLDPSAGLPGPPLPRGSVPPGARFDPFGPPTRPPRPRGPPGSEEFPPGFGDMFM